MGQWSPQWRNATRWLARCAPRWLRRLPGRCARRSQSPSHQLLSSTVLLLHMLWWKPVLLLSQLWPTMVMDLLRLSRPSTVRPSTVLVPTTSTEMHTTSKLLGLVPPGVSDQQGAVVLDKDVLDLLLALLINVLLVVGDQGLGESLSDGVALSHVTSSLHADADINVSKPVLAEKKHWLEELELERLGLDLLKRAAIDLDETLAPH